MAEISQGMVEGWIKEMGCVPTLVDDERAEWRIQINYPPLSPHQVHVIRPKGQARALVIASGATVTPQHIKAFEELDDDAKADFLWELRGALNQHYVEFSMVGANGALDCPTQFGVTVTRYDDGLSLDSFARSVSSAFKTELSGIMVVQKHLGGRGYGSAGRFDFRKAGL